MVHLDRHRDAQLQLQLLSADGGIVTVPVFPQSASGPLLVLVTPERTFAFGKTVAYTETETALRAALFSAPDVASSRTYTLVARNTGTTLIFRPMWIRNPRYSVFRPNEPQYIQQLEPVGRQPAPAVLLGWGVLASKDREILYTSDRPARVENTPMHSVTTGGPQSLVISHELPLLLFDLDVALEWDARNDGQFTK
ncbi:MAG: hypothetical protein IPK16_29895, partial [Anaerolineales bacterium]|nr:hypothetical protein [Anaerolineales bacterium]